MSQMMHIVRKDVRRLRWLLVLGLVVLITRVALVVNGASAADESVATGLLLQQVWETMAIIELLLMAGIVAQLVLEEPLVGLTPEFSGPLVVKKGAQTKTFKVHDEFVPFSQQAMPSSQRTRSFRKVSGAI